MSKVSNPIHIQVNGENYKTLAIKLVCKGNREAKI
jgi:hypothetical protein